MTLAFFSDPHPIVNYSREEWLDNKISRQRGDGVGSGLSFGFKRFSAF